MSEKNLNLTPQQKMTLWAVWDYASTRRKADADGADDARGPVITKKAVKDRYADKFGLEFKEKEFDTLADKRVLRADPDAGAGCYRMHKRDAVEAAYREVEGEYAGG